jgi:hypothetical protein
MGYARAAPSDDAGLTDDAVLSARYAVDIAGETFAVTPHLRAPA